MSDRPAIGVDPAFDLRAEALELDAVRNASAAYCSKVPVPLRRSAGA
ncbi:hypothetical protein SUDANB105_07832 [Streptomyces sp. enrichment culture]